MNSSLKIGILVVVIGVVLLILSLTNKIQLDSSLVLGILALGVGALILFNPSIIKSLTNLTKNLSSAELLSNTVNSRSNKTLTDIKTDDYRVLLGLGTLISFAGWAVVLISAVFIIYGIMEMNRVGPILIAGGILAALVGLLSVAYGQVISCFVSIERNTKGTFEILKQISIDKK